MPDVERLSIAVRRDGLAGDVLHGEVRSPVGGDAAVEQTRDVRMLKTRQNLALAKKAPDDLSTVRAGPDELEGDVLFELAVGAIREEHTAHPAVADLAYQLVRPDAVTGLLLLIGRIGGRRCDQPRGVLHRGSLEEVRRIGIGGDQGLYPRTQDRVAGARAIERRGARRGLEVQHVVEDRLDSGPFLRAEGGHDVLSRDLESPETETLAPSATRA